jgi:signal transduction histidine kinase
VLSEVAAQVVQLGRAALSNVSRHVQAAICRISLYRDGATLVLEIDDDSQGFDPAGVRPGGQGLGNLRDRAAAIGGPVEVNSRWAAARASGSRSLSRHYLPIHE